MAGLEGEMKHLLQPSRSPGDGGLSLGCCLGVVLLSDGRWWKMAFLPMGQRGWSIVAAHLRR